MGYATEINNEGRATTLRDQFNRIIDTFAERRAKARTYRKTLHELRNLTDRDLADLGVARENIHDIARQAAYGA